MLTSQADGLVFVLTLKTPSLAGLALHGNLILDSPFRTSGVASVGEYVFVVSASLALGYFIPTFNARILAGLAKASY